MSETVAELIHAFSNLTPHERYAVLIELARISESDNGPLEDEELTLSGEQVFAMYDAEEADRGETGTR